MSKLSANHWAAEYYRQRVTRKEWKEILLEHGDSIIFRGRLRKLKAQHLGAGVYEIYKLPYKETL